LIIAKAGHPKTVAGGQTDESMWIVRTIIILFILLKIGVIDFIWDNVFREREGHLSVVVFVAPKWYLTQ